MPSFQTLTGPAHLRGPAPGASCPRSPQVRATHNPTRVLEDYVQLKDVAALLEAHLAAEHARHRRRQGPFRRSRRREEGPHQGAAAAREGAEPPITAEAVSRVTEHLKMKVKALYAPDRGGDSGLWALRPIAVDARRYAALDVWLLGEIHDAMTSSESLDEEWTGRVVRASEARVVEYRDAKEPVLQFRDPERAVAPDI